jgi:hypothetical protein
VLTELRRAAYATHGAPLTTASDPLILPRTQQHLATAGGTGAWKAVAGERFDLPGGDVLVSILPLGANSTLYAIGVDEGACAPGTTAAPAEVAVSLFPRQLGPVWVDDRRGRVRWRAWACAGEAARLTVLGPVDGDQPPTGLEARMIQAMVTEVARSYGLDVSDDRGRRGVASERGAHVVATGFAGVVSIAPLAGDRRQGALAGISVRMADRGILGPALAFDLEVGFGDGGLIGEVRTGGGVSGGVGGAVLDVVAGAAVGSLGPSAEIDFYAQTSLSLPLGPTRLWLGALHAVGVDGPDQDRLELRLAVPHHDDVGFYLGARQVWFDDAGSALLVTIGGGVVGTD